MGEEKMEVPPNLDHLLSFKEVVEEAIKNISDPNRKVLDLNNWANFNIPEIIGGDMVTLLGGTGVGKTYAALHLCKSTKEKILLFEMELSVNSLGVRMLAMENGISTNETLYRIKNKQPLKTIGMENVTTVFEASLSPRVINQDITNHITKYGEKPLIVMIDYFQLVGCGLNNAFQDTMHAARTMKTIAKGRDVIIVIFSQINREAQKRDGEVLLNDAKMAGQIEESSSLVLALNKMNTETEKKKNLSAVEMLQGEGKNHTSEYYIKVLKNSNGKSGQKVYFEFDWDTTSFYPIRNNQ